MTNKIVKGSYNRHLIEQNNGDPNAFWKTFKKILPGECKEMPSRIRIGENISSDMNTIANAFNNFFANTAHRLLNSFRETLSMPYIIGRNKDFVQAKQRPPFEFKEVSEASIHYQLRCLKFNKAVGLEDIPPRLLKDGAQIVAQPLTNITNASLKQAKVPTEWKSARVIPLFKKGKKDDIDNYRPISILPMVSKVLERVVHIQLVKYIRDHKILSPYQCGFGKGHSTEFVALSFADTIRRNIDLGQLTGAVFVDLRKAFDTVDHLTLLNKLSAVGITIICWCFIRY